MWIKPRQRYVDALGFIHNRKHVNSKTVLTSCPASPTFRNMNHLMALLLLLLSPFGLIWFWIDGAFRKR